MNAEDLLGYRFDPKDEELVEYYLFPKVQQGSPIFNGIIPDADVYSSQPETLLQQGFPISTDLERKVCYFFAHRTRKSAKGTSAKRVLDLGNGISGGSWVCKDRPNMIVNKITNEQLGTKRLLTYKRDGKSTDWRMHEYTLEGRNVKPNPDLQSTSSVLGKRKAAPQFLDHVVCCLFYKPPSSSNKKNKEDGETGMEEEDEEEEEEPTISHHHQLEEQQQATTYSIPMSQPGVPTTFKDVLSETEKFLFSDDDNLPCTHQDIGQKTGEFMEEPTTSHHHQMEDQQQPTTSCSYSETTRVPTSFTEMMLSETAEFLFDDDENLTFTYQDIGQQMGELVDCL